MIWLLVVVPTILAALYFAWPRHRTEVTTLENLADRLIDLREGKRDQSFFGFYARDIDSIYFAFEQGSYWLEYELADEQRAELAEAKINLADALRMQQEGGSYGKTPNISVR